MMHATCVNASKASRACIRSAPTRMHAIKVSNYQVTLETPTGCKKYQLEANKSLLEGALAAGVEVPHLCKTGTCGVCAAKLLSGNIERDDFLLDDAQKDAGYLLLCTTTATSDVEIKTQQEAEMHTLPYGI